MRGRTRFAPATSSATCRRHSRSRRSTLSDDLLGQRFPVPFVEALMARYAAHLEQSQRPPTNEVEKILGRSARTYAEWVADYAFAFGTDEEKGDN